LFPDRHHHHHHHPILVRHVSQRPEKEGEWGREEKGRGERLKRGRRRRRRRRKEQKLLAQR
jgi:hypothetical protein